MRCALVILALASGCGTVDRGRVNMHGTTPGDDASIVPNACQFSGVFSGVVTGKRGVAFTSKDGPAVVTINDDGAGPRLQIGRVLNGVPTVREFDGKQCTALAFQLQPTGWVINGSPLVGIDAQIECTADGVNVAGTVHFPRCGTSREAESILNVFQNATMQGPEGARLAALPRIPQHSVVPDLPPILRGLTFHAEGRIAGATLGAETVEHAQQTCASSLEPWLTAAGWTAVHDPQGRAALDIEIQCTGHVSWSQHGNLIEIQYPASDTPAATLKHHGVVIATVPRGPSDFVCETGGPAQQAFAACAASAEEWAHARIMSSLASSEPLAKLAQQLQGGQ